jgi:hypothetical protein
MKKLGIRRPAPPRLGSRLLSRELSVGLSVGSMSARQFAVSSLPSSNRQFFSSFGSVSFWQQLLAPTACSVQAASVRAVRPHAPTRYNPHLPNSSGDYRTIELADLIRDDRGTYDRACFVFDSTR